MWLFLKSPFLEIHHQFLTSIRKSIHRLVKNNCSEGRKSIWCASNNITFFGHTTLAQGSGPKEKLTRIPTRRQQHRNSRMCLLCVEGHGMLMSQQTHCVYVISSRRCFFSWRRIITIPSNNFLLLVSFVWKNENERDKLKLTYFLHTEVDLLLGITYKGTEPLYGGSLTTHVTGFSLSAKPR